MNVSVANTRRLASPALFLASIALLVLMAISWNPPAAKAEVHAIAEGELDWGIKESWRNYIGEGGTTMLDGASRNSDGTFHFPLVGGSYDDTTRETVIEFGGGVEFLGHCEGAGGTHVRPCALDMTLRNLRVEITEDHAGVFVDAESRPISGGGIVYDEDVQLVDLDVENAEPAFEDGNTTWSEVTAAISLDGSRIFTYGLGTIIDPVNFEYEGPGGKPAGESWDAPGVTNLEAEEAETQPEKLPIRVVGTLGTGELVGWHEWGQLAILDPDTLEAKSEWLSGLGNDGWAEIFRDSVAIDPATDTVFAAEKTTNLGDRRLLTFEWDGTELTRTEIAGSYDPTLVHDSGSGGTWDAANDRYVIARASSVEENHLWEVKQVDDVWTASKVDRILPVTEGNLFANALVNLEAVPDGAGRSAIVATTLIGAGHVLRLTPTPAGFVPEKLVEAGDLNADRIFRTATGLHVVAPSDGLAAFIPFVGYADNRRLGEASEPVPFDSGVDFNRNQGRLTFDYASDSLVGVTDSNTLISRLERGSVVYRGSIGGGPYGGTLIDFNSDGEVRGAVGDTLNTLSVTGVSPRFASQPEPPVARLLEGTDEITLTAGVEGTPAPELTWQTRILGQGGWQDLSADDGADGATLTTTVDAEDGGRQYRLIAENEHGRVASDRVSLQVLTPPSIVVQPGNVSVAPGEAAELKVMPQGHPEPDVQWQQRLGGVWHDIPGASGAIFVFGSVDTSISGSVFRARLTNELGSVISSNAVISVTQLATEPVWFDTASSSVDWGFAERFRCYVTGMIARGQITTTGPVTKIPGTAPTGGSLCSGTNPANGQPWGTGGEALRFGGLAGVFDGTTPLAPSYDPGTGKLRVDLAGTVRFWGHDYHVPGNTTPQLDTTLSKLRIEIDTGTGEGFVYTDARGATMESPEPIVHTNTKLARFDASGLNLNPADGRLVLENIPTFLHADGTEILGTYPEGEPFDPLGLDLAVGEPPVVPQPPVKALVMASIGHAPPSLLKARTRIGRVACPKAATAPCKVNAPAKVKFKAGGKLAKAQKKQLKKRFKVAVSKSLAPGRSAPVQIRLTKRQRKVLGGKKLRGSLKVRVTVAGGKTVSQTLKVAARVG